jgi:hypothetical protein
MRANVLTKHAREEAGREGGIRTRGVHS